MWGFLTLAVLHIMVALKFARITPLRIYFDQECDQFYFVFNDIKHYKRKIIEVVRPGELEHCPWEMDPWLNPARHKIEPVGRKLILILPMYFQSQFYYRKLTGTNFEDFDRDSKYA